MKPIFYKMSMKHNTVFSSNVFDTKDSNKRARWLLSLSRSRWDWLIQHMPLLLAKFDGKRSRKEGFSMITRYRNYQTLFICLSNEEHYIDLFWILLSCVTLLGFIKSKLPSSGDVDENFRNLLQWVINENQRSQALRGVYWKASRRFEKANPRALLRMASMTL